MKSSNSFPRKKWKGVRRTRWMEGRFVGGTNLQSSTPHCLISHKAEALLLRPYWCCKQLILLGQSTPHKPLTSRVYKIATEPACRHKFVHIPMEENINSLWRLHRPIVINFWYEERRHISKLIQLLVFNNSWILGLRGNSARWRNGQCSVSPARKALECARSLFL